MTFMYLNKRRFLRGLGVICGLAALADPLAVLAQAPAGAPPAPITAESKAALVNAASAPKRQTAFWVENGKAMAARGADVAKAPQGATVIEVKVFDLGGGQNYREITIRKGDMFSPPKGMDALVYVLKGKLEVKLGSVTGTVGPGDAFRKIAIQDNNYKAIEETVIIETDAPGPKS